MSEHVPLIICVVLLVALGGVCVSNDGSAENKVKNVCIDENNEEECYFECKLLNSAKPYCEYHIGKNEEDKKLEMRVFNDGQYEIVTISEKFIDSLSDKDKQEVYDLIFKITSVHEFGYGNYWLHDKIKEYWFDKLKVIVWRKEDNQWTNG